MSTQNITGMQNDTVRSWKAYTTDRTREAGPVRSVDLEDGIYGGMLPLPTHYPCTVDTWCYGGCTAHCG